MDPGQKLPPSNSTSQAMLEFRFQLIGLCFGFYASVLLFFHLLSSTLSHVYNTLQAKQKFYWNHLATRSVFGIQSLVAGLTALTWDSEFSRDIMRGQENWSWSMIFTTAGYFLFENVAFHTYNLVFRSFDLALAIHHLYALSVFFCLAFISDSGGHYVPVVALLLEMSTPFICISWMLQKVGWGKSQLWKANQWVMIHTFHIRMVVTYYIWWVCLSHWAAVNNNYPLTLRLIFYIGLTLLTVIINPFWTYKKTMQLFNSLAWNFDHKMEPVNITGDQADVSVKPHAS
ncbi:protein CLN8-like [Hippocampus comes]|uniref:protein CLN8-like n=1 Tax=Hippocampus comes TaxID=109280 RepID=UPI00094EA116|nr:PREDICTED: protein CLN8-like [Hippocampus comes]XP_019745244.1 PREDICTED: protein CLN8-like [Hippocampus comes]